MRTFHPKTRRGMERELAKVHREIVRLHKKIPLLTGEESNRLACLRGAQQALAWALNQPASAPTKTFVAAAPEAAEPAR